MYIIIDNNGKYGLDFVKYLLKRLIYIYAYCADQKRLKIFEDYFNSDDSKLFDKKYLPISINKIINMILSNLIIREYSNKYIIKVNPLAEYNSVKIDTLNKIINSGTLEIKGYPLFRIISMHINKNMDKYYNKYVSMGIL